MEKKVSAFTVRRQFGKILHDIASQGDNVLVERHGEPVAALVPISVYEQWKEGRRQFFDRMRTIADRTGLDPDEADALVSEAVAAVRAEAKG